MTRRISELLPGISSSEIVDREETGRSRPRMSLRADDQDCKIQGPSPNNATSDLYDSEWARERMRSWVSAALASSGLYRHSEVCENEGKYDAKNDTRVGNIKRAMTKI